MDEQKKEIQDVNSDTIKDDSEKQTNKVFTQSDVDKLIGREIKKVKDQFGDYDDLKGNLNTLLEEKKKLELAEKTEIEKKEIAIKELNEKLSGIESNYQKVLKVNLRNEILSDEKYSILPKVYKNSVSLSDKDDEIRQSADAILEEYLKDIEAIQGKESFGKPITKKENSQAKTKTLADRVKQVISSHYENYKAMQGGLNNG